MPHKKMLASPQTYLQDIVAVLRTHWPQNRTINIVAHGHSVPAGYFATPFVDTFHAYPHLLHAALKHRYPFAVINVIVTAIGGENSQSGAARFADSVLTHRPDVLLIDYGLNDRGLGLPAADAAWRSMIAQAKDAGSRVILLTPTPDQSQRPEAPEDERAPLREHAAQIRALAEQQEIGLADSLAAFEACQQGGDLGNLLSWSNHTNHAGHEIVTRELLRWFPA